MEFQARNGESLPEHGSLARPSASKAWPWAVGAVLLLGFALRLTELLGRPPLWVDEAFLSLNIGPRTFLGLLQPLDYAQTAPFPFLWATKTVTLIGGMNEFALRMVPFLCGVVLLYVIWSFTRRLDRRIALLATLLAALSPLLLRYSNEVKQYGPDALVTMLVAGLVMRVLEQPDSRAAWRWLAVGGVAALILSQPSAFVLAGAGCGLVCDRSVRGVPGWVGRLAGIAALWLTVFGLLYFLSYRGVASSPYMRQFWERTYLDPSAPDLGFRVWRAGWIVLMSPLEVETSFSVRLMVPVFLVGLFALARRSRAAFPIFVAATYAAVLSAGIFGFYPISARTYTFLTPLLCLTYAAAAVLLCDLVPRPARRGAYAVAVVVLGLWPALSVWDRITSPSSPWNSRLLIQELSSRPDGVPVYIYAGGFTAWVFYTTDWAAPDLPRLQWAARLAGPNGPVFENAAPRGRPVRCEGDSLIRSYRGRTEIIGIAAGIQVTEPDRWWWANPDSGWAVNEARRIRAAASPTAWIFASHFQDRWIPQLLREVRAAGGRIPEAKFPIQQYYGDYGAALFHVRFPPEASNGLAPAAPTCEAG